MNMITLRHTRRNVVDVGIFDTEFKHGLEDVPEGKFALVLGSTDDAGVVGAAKPEQQIPADVWKQAAKLKVIQHMLDKGHLVVH